MKKNNQNLVKGPIFKTLIKLALPIMATSFIQMAYNLIDILWIGRLGSKAVASVGTAGFYLWLGFGFILLTKVGAEIKVSQNVGAEKPEIALNYARNAISINLILSISYGLVLFFLSDYLIGFFDLKDTLVIEGGITYLKIVAWGIPAMFFINVITGVFNGYGDSKTPFIITSLGLILNMVLDPLLIFGVGPFSAMGIGGAALATVISQIVVGIVYIIIMVLHKKPFKISKLYGNIDYHYMIDIFKIGLPVALHSGLFTLFSMLIARIIAGWGPIPIAVQKVGSQIEAISWMTASGFSTALSTFTGQNYGANNWKRVWKGYFSAISIMGTIGIITSLLLIFAAKPIFSVFIAEEEALKYGITYLRILGLSQFFMCVEITTSGAFNGLGKTLPPSITSIILTGARVPAALILSKEALLGLNGIWWSISLSSVMKGLVLITLYMMFLFKNPEIDHKEVIGFLKNVINKREQSTV